MLDVIKTCLRISHNKLNDDIQGYIDACERDLSLAGISVTESDPLIIQAVKLYCRWQYNFEGQADRYERAYKSLKTSLGLSGDYLE